MTCKLFLFAVLLTANAAFAQQTTRLVIHFDFDKYTVRPEDAAAIDNLFQQRGPSAVKSIELSGHCDFIGDHAYNDALSNRRVEQTKACLAGKGVSETVFVRAEGFGKRRPLNENSSPEERSDNRRVELLITWQPADTVMKAAPPENKPPVSLAEIIKDTTTKSGRNIILRNLQFQPGRHFLLPQSMPILDELYQVMVDNPALVVEIQGHVCCTPDNEDGLDLDLGTNDLSVQRAKSIYEHLVSRNIAPARLSYAGFGGSRKLYPLERDDFERQENRRVELRVIKR